MKRQHLLLLVLLSVIYTVIVFATPVSPSLLVKYHISMAQYRILDVFILLPVYAIWGVAFYGFSVFQSYSRTIKKHADGVALNKIAGGIMVLAIGSPVTSIVSSLASYYTGKHLGSVPKQVIITNYLTMFITVAGLYLVYIGAVELCRLTRKRFYDSGNRPYNQIFIGLSSLYTYLFLVHLPAANNIPITATTHAAYYTPTEVLVPTLLIPYLIAWYLGILAVYLIRFYKSNIGGLIYANALNYLSYGIAIVVVTSIGEQILTVFTGPLQNLSTAPLIVLIYILLLVIGAGYLFIAMGAKRLKSIENV